MKKKKLESIEWDEYRVFLAVARTGSLAQAAKFLKCDHSTVSRKVAQLELSLGGAVFERHRQGLRLTDMGKSILNPIERMESGAVEIREILGNQEEPEGAVRIAMMEGIGSLYIARRLKPLLDKYPKLKIELVTSAQTVNVDKREADIFLSFFKPKARGLFSESPGKIGLCLYAAKPYIDTYGMPVSVSDLKQHYFVSYIEDYIQVDCIRWLDDVILNPKISLYSNSMIAQMSAAASGVGIVLLPHFSVEKENTLFPIFEQEVKVSRDLWLSVHTDLQYAPRIRIVINYLEQLLKDEQKYLYGI